MEKKEKEKVSQEHKWYLILPHFHSGKFNNKFNAFTLMTQETVTTPQKHAHIDIKTFTIRLHVGNELLIIL